MEREKPIQDCRCQGCNFKSIPASILNNEELKILCNNSVHIEFQPGEKIIKQGSFTTNIVYLTQGLAKLHMTGPLNKDEILKIAKSSVFIGVPSVFADRIFHYSVSALTKCEACFIDFNSFEQLVKDNGTFAHELIISLSEDVIGHFHRCVNKTQKNKTGYIAEILLDFADNYFESNDFTLPLSRAEFGELIGSSRETVIRILQEFINDGLIKDEGKKITIIEKEKLEKISER
ncbi:MAG: Crp/Fnr family transcriptional regulator [Bacteroidales bacterium]